jgi:hypothetical protein
MDPGFRQEVNMQQKVIDLLRSTERPGIENLIDYLIDKTDFFVAPASTQYHGSKEGGLLEHSLAVLENLEIVIDNFAVKDWFQGGYTQDTLVIVALLHDICKTNFYTTAIRNIKNNDTGQWEHTPYITIDDQFPLGHGEKSVMILQRYIWLHDDELMAIRWHMAGFDDTARSYAGGLALNNALKKYPLITALHMADLAASYFEGK